jgi:hypothetical protein
MKNAEAVLSVKFNSIHSNAKLMRLLAEDMDGFMNVPGLIQKYCLAEPSTGAITDMYIFEDRYARATFWASKTARNILPRYGAITDTIRVEQYDMAIALHKEVLSWPMIAHRHDNLAFAAPTLANISDRLAGMMPGMARRAITF